MAPPRTAGPIVPGRALVQGTIAPTRPVCVGVRHLHLLRWCRRPGEAERRDRQTGTSTRRCPPTLVAPAKYPPRHGIFDFSRRSSEPAIAPIPAANRGLGGATPFRVIRMSRNDSHAPFHVCFARREITVVAVHRCASHDCDLPDRGASTRSRCRWQVVYTGMTTCSAYESVRRPIRTSHPHPADTALARSGAASVDVIRAWNGRGRGTSRGPRAAALFPPQQSPVNYRSARIRCPARHRR